MSELKPSYEEIQAHYDISNDFFALFLDESTMSYSCGVFATESSTLDEAQTAKIDKMLDKADLKPGHKLLDIGAGWGGTLRRAAMTREVSAVGLTLSKAQAEFSNAWNADLGAQAQIHLKGWEEFDEPVDRVVTIEAFEHFRGRYPPFFEKMYRLLPEDGVLVIQSTVAGEVATLVEKGIRMTSEDVRFLKFMHREVFPGFQLSRPHAVIEYAESAGFKDTGTESLQPHYVRTLGTWANRLRSRRDEAIALTSGDTYDMYIRYIEGCAERFDRGVLDCMQFRFAKA